MTKTTWLLMWLERLLARSMPLVRYRYYFDCDDVISTCVRTAAGQHRRLCSLWNPSSSDRLQVFGSMAKCPLLVCRNSGISSFP